MEATPCFIFTGKWIWLETRKVEEAVVLVSIDPVQMRLETFCFRKIKPVERALSDGELERG